MSENNKETASELEAIKEEIKAERKPRKAKDSGTNPWKVFTGILVVLLVISLASNFSVNSEIASIKEQVNGLTGAVTGLSTSVTSAVASGGTSPGSGVSLEALKAEIMPKGTPDYGEEAGVSYDNVESSLRTLAGYEKIISLSGADQERFIKIATTKGTACEFCCGIGDAGFGTSTGRIACGCSHNVAFGGLTKWLIKNSDYTDDQIVEEIGKWKLLFFPRDALAKELQKRNINPESVGLPAMVGGC